MYERPPSLDEIIKRSKGTEISKPKFLSKKEREELSLKKKSDDANSKKQQELASKRKRRAPSCSHNDETLKSNGDSKKAAKTKTLNFEWSEVDDTSEDYQPLVRQDGKVNMDDLGFEDKHWSEKSIGEMKERDWRIFKEDYSIVTKGSDIAPPLRSWEESKFQKKLLDVIEKLKFFEPTPVQRAAIPVALQNRDLVGIAETGSGKTLAYLLPLFSYILSVDFPCLVREHLEEGNMNRPLGLILAPARELALQITKEAEKFASSLGLNVVPIIGGHKYEETVHSTSNGAHVVVGTPGRLLDSLERGLINVDKCYFLIMDEADRIIYMGFEKAIQSIMSYLPTTDDLIRTRDSSFYHLKKRTTLMFTATITPRIEQLTKNYLLNPIHLVIGTTGSALDNIDVRLEYLPQAKNSEDEVDPNRIQKLVKVLRSYSQKLGKYSTIIFANYKRVCDLIFYELNKKGFNETVVLHGSKSQESREKAIESFRSGKTRILIATDVAARGIDIPNVSLVVNFQMAKGIDEFIHRIGRTGRAGSHGSSVTFVDDSDSDLFIHLKKFLQQSNKECPSFLMHHQATKINYLRE